MRAGAGTRGPRFRLLRAAAAMALIAGALSSLPAQETGAGTDATVGEAAAVLVSGPARGRSLPFLPPNTIEYQRGVYELPGASGSAAADAASTPAAEDPGSAPPATPTPGGAAPAGEVTVEVFYTEAPVFRRGTWTESACDGRTVHALPEAGGTVVHYAWPQEQRHVFFRFPAVVEGNAAAAPGDVAATPGDAAATPGDAAATAVARSECDFIDAFLERISFFLDTTDVSGAAPFPAVLPR